MLLAWHTYTSFNSSNCRRKKRSKNLISTRNQQLNGIEGFIKFSLIPFCPEPSRSCLNFIPLDFKRTPQWGGVIALSPRFLMTVCFLDLSDLAFHIACDTVSGDLHFTVFNYAVDCILASMMMTKCSKGLLRMDGL